MILLTSKNMNKKILEKRSSIPRSVIINTMIAAIIIILIWTPCASQTTENSFIKISKNGRYFIDGNGNPFFLARRY